MVCLPIMSDGTGSEGGISIQVEGALRLGMNLHRQGRLDEAEKLYRAVLEYRPRSADALHYLGLLLFQIDRGIEGLALIRRALEEDPAYAAAWNNLGNVLDRQGDDAGAEEAWRRAIEIEPTLADAHANLAVALRRKGELAESEASARRALAVNPKHPEGWLQLGKALRWMDRMEEATEAFRRAAELTPQNAAVLHPLVRALARLGKKEEGARLLREWLVTRPDDAEARHFLAAFGGIETPARASDAYVTKLFDTFADVFDKNLQNLRYSAPERVAEALEDAMGPPSGSLDILDAGCGTGLCAPFLRRHARRLEGVDLSSKMIARAKDRGGYDALHVGELTAHLGEAGGVFDAVVSADTLCYFGDLAPACVAAARALKPGGVLIFTVERATPEETEAGFAIRTSGRYAHAERHVRDALAAAGFEPPRLGVAPLRTEYGQPVEGFVVTARLSGGEAVR